MKNLIVKLAQRPKMLAQYLILVMMVVVPSFGMQNTPILSRGGSPDLPPTPEIPGADILPTPEAVSADLPPTPDAPAQLHYFIPLVVKPEPPTIMTGMYTPKFYNDQGVKDSLVAADSFAGKKHSLGALFWSMEDNPDYNLLVQLNTLWSYGYTPFINISSSDTCNYNDLTDRTVMQKFADGRKDAAIIQTAKAYKKFIDGGTNRKAFLAPFPEMNGDWTCYHSDPSVFKTAYDRIRTIFVQQGVALNKAWWVFPPNGYTEAGGEFEKYYPGDSKVDVVAFSSYNFGYCPIVRVDWRSWTEPVTVFGSYITRIQTMAPTKPIIIAQTGTTAYNLNKLDHAKKNQWLIDAYNYLATQKGVIGVLYFDITRSGECDYPVFNNALTNYTGYGRGIANPQYIYIKPDVLSQMDLTVSH